MLLGVKTLRSIRCSNSKKIKMKNLLIALFVCFSFAIQAQPTDYIVLNNGSDDVIFVLSHGSSGNDYIGSYLVSSPQISILEGIGLPSHLWGRLSGPDGIYDTRYEDCKNYLENERVTSNAYKEESDSLRNAMHLWRLGFFFMIIAFGMVIIALAPKKRR